MPGRVTALGRDDRQLNAPATAVRAWYGTGLQPRWLTARTRASTIARSRPQIVPGWLSITYHAP